MKRSPLKNFNGLYFLILFFPLMLPVMMVDGGRNKSIAFVIALVWECIILFILKWKTIDRLILYCVTRPKNRFLRSLASLGVLNFIAVCTFMSVWFTLRLAGVLDREKWIVELFLGLAGVVVAATLGGLLSKPVSSSVGSNSYGSQGAHDA